MGISLLTTEQPQRCKVRFRRPHTPSAGDCKEAPIIPDDRIEAMRGLLHGFSLSLAVWAVAIYLLLAR